MDTVTDFWLLGGEYIEKDVLFSSIPPGESTPAAGNHGKTGFLSKCLESHR